jgi:uncharacterized protein YjiS (DUF1127 family)
MLKKLLNMFNERRRYSETVKQLSNLTDRDLEDLGISRCDIPRVARETTRKYKKLQYCH